MDAFVSWMQTTSLSHAIVSYLWVWPAAESAHFIGLALIIGTVGFFDLRLAGAFKSVPVSAAHDLMPFALVGQDIPTEWAVKHGHQAGAMV